MNEPNLCATKNARLIHIQYNVQRPEQMQCLTFVKYVFNVFNFMIIIIIEIIFFMVKMFSNPESSHMNVSGTEKCRTQIQITNKRTNDRANKTMPLIIT